MTWTAKMKDDVVRLWNDGQSATEIRKWLRKRYGLEFSRNAVIGVIFRSGQKSRVKDSPAPKAPRVPPARPSPRVAQRVPLPKPVLTVVKDEPRVSQPEAPKPQVKKFPEPKRAKYEATGEPLVPAIFGLPDPTCRWIIGEALEGRTCQAERRPGSPYCPKHHAKAYVPLTPEQKAGKVGRIRW